MCSRIGAAGAAGAAARIACLGVIAWCAMSDWAEAPAALPLTGRWGFLAHYLQRAHGQAGGMELALDLGSGAAGQSGGCGRVVGAAGWWARGGMEGGRDDAIREACRRIGQLKCPIKRRNE